jgi:hypothetical protein
MNPTDNLPLFSMARASDPSTSHAAAVEHRADKLSERRAQVYQVVRLFPGSTQGELARRMYQQFGNLPIATCCATPHKRLPELEKLGLVKRGKERVCEDSGYMSATWEVV